jgi:hypothetical protein
MFQVSPGKRAASLFLALLSGGLWAADFYVMLAKDMCLVAQYQLIFSFFMALSWFMIALVSWFPVRFHVKVRVRQGALLTSNRLWYIAQLSQAFLLVTYLIHFIYFSKGTLDDDIWIYIRN